MGDLDSGLSVGTMRETWPLRAVLVSTITALAPSDSRAPRTKSTCPPTPLYYTGPNVSAQIWPSRSTSNAPFTATMFRFRLITDGLLV